MKPDAPNCTRSSRGHRLGSLAIVALGASLYAAAAFAGSVEMVAAPAPNIEAGLESAALVCAERQEAFRSELAASLTESVAAPFGIF